MLQKNIDNFTDYLLIVTGPTAAGKSALSLKLAEYFPIEIINADVGQFYTPLSIGTAKPAWQNQPVPHHLYNILDEPTNFTVRQFRDALFHVAQEIWQRGHLPIVVGGSQFYIKSLFFPPHQFAPADSAVVAKLHAQYAKLDDEALWQELARIDSKRATDLHPRDRYRVERALDIWHLTGKKPSFFLPQFSPLAHSRIVYVAPSASVLEGSIAKRTKLVIQQWIEEAAGLIATPWEPFVRRKGFIGYDMIF